MIPLSAPLDDMNFDALVEIARSNLPTLAPDWTDYNYSDPGITLLELLAWIADSQIYSIARDRADERTQMAGLLGIAAQGTHPATGAVYPREKIGMREPVKAGTRLIPDGACAPRLETLVETPLWPVEVASVVVESEGGSVDHTATNTQARASYAPFGDPPSRDAVLRVGLAGILDAGMVKVSLGFEIEDDAEEGSDGLGGVNVTCLAPGGGETRVTVELDTTGGLRRSGVMLLRVPVAAGAAAGPVLLFRSAQNALVPRLLRITTNALAVVQRATLSPPQPFPGTGRPDQRIAIEPQSLFEPDEAAEGQVWRLVQAEAGLALEVRVREGKVTRLWSRGTLSEAGPTDEQYELSEQPDGSRIELLFGNGINGRRPPLGAEIEVRMTLSAGAGGNVAGIAWQLKGSRTQWRNFEPIGGGKDADDLDDLLSRLRARLRGERTLATSAQIEGAARGLSRAYGIKRVAILEGWEPGRRRPASAATRTLLVTRKGNGDETDDWRRAIARELGPRIALAERFLVASPVWRELRVRVRAVAAPGRVPADVAKEIRAELADRLLPTGRRGADWPLGQDVTAMAVGGWVRRLDGVASVTELILLDARGRPIESGIVTLARNELPRLAAETDDVAVVPGAVG